MGTIVFIFWLAFAELKIQEFWLAGNPATDCVVSVCIWVFRIFKFGCLKSLLVIRILITK